MRSLAPWNDRRGRFCALRFAAVLAAAAPGAWIAYGLSAGLLGAEPVEAAIHLAGQWTIYFLLATLAVTPLKRLLAWPRLAGLRRMIGLTTFTYVIAHLVLYVVSEGGDLGTVAGEIAKRPYLTIGFVALLGLGALAATSFDAAIRRLGRTWKRLHGVVYGLAVLGLVHFLLQSKIDVTQPVILAGVFVGLMLHRVPAILRLGVVPAVLGVAVVAGLATAGIEYAWYAGMTGVPAGRVFLANFDLSFGLRPMWIVMLICALPLPVRGLRALVGMVGSAGRAGMRGAGVRSGT